MIQVLNNILFYLNLAAVLQSQNDTTTNLLNQSEIVNETLAEQLPPVLLKQIPPGPIVPGVLVKFVCAVDNETSIGGCVNVANNNTYYKSDEFSYQWEMFQYMEDKDGNMSNTNVVKLPGEYAEMEMAFNESVANPKSHCDLVCTIKSNQRPSSASIKLHFLSKDSQKTKLSPPTDFKMWDVTARAVYFSWVPPPQPEKSEGQTSSDITGYIIEYKNGKGTKDWTNEKVSRYEIKRGNISAACVTNLNPWTTYHFRIFSVSRNVSSSPSFPIIVRTVEDLPSGSPVDVKIETVEEKVLRISWKPPPRTTWNGALLGYNIGLKKVSSSEDEPYEIYVLSPLETLGNVYFYQITVADSTTLYWAVVRAFNNIGSGPFSHPVTQPHQQPSLGDG